MKFDRKQQNSVKLLSFNKKRKRKNNHLIEKSEIQVTGGNYKAVDESERGKRKSWLKAQHSENEDHGHPVPSLHGK